MWELYAGIAIASSLAALYTKKKGSWIPKTKQKYLELQDTDNFEYSYTPKQTITEKKDKYKIPGPKSKFDSLFEYGRRDNPEIDPEKQKKLREEIDRIKEEEREYKQNLQNNRIGEIESDFNKNPSAFSTTAPQPQKTYNSYSNTLNNSSNNYSNPRPNNAFMNNQNTQPNNTFNTQNTQPTTQRSTSGFGSNQPSGGSSFLGSIMDSAIQAKTRNQQTQTISESVSQPQPNWSSTQDTIKKEEPTKKDNKDKDWVPMGLFGN
ncbi:hypothetical protein GQ473_06960 [archaeon]|nr:hypothetical protein [archaeon]